jgi:glycosyltransferase involved in cell wall biosynthesis
VTNSPLFSIIINNYNYGRFLGDAIDSALAQRYPNREVIVVDDGSTDNSRQIISRYTGKVVPVLRENGGQAAALNTGLMASSGDLILFLDADDLLLPHALESVAPLFVEDSLAKVHWPLEVVDASRRPTGQITPDGDLPEGDLLPHLARHGPYTHLFSPTSGNAWSRSFLNEVFPIPEAVYQARADSYLCELAPAFGLIGVRHVPLGLYRMHGSNDHLVVGFEETISRHIRAYDFLVSILRRRFEELQLGVDPDAWQRGSWFHRLQRASEDIAAIVPPQHSFVLVDEAQWGLDDSHRPRPVPFIEGDGQYGGPPADDGIAIQELERLRATGASHVVIGWPAFWWLDHYSGLDSYLRSKYQCVLQNDRVIIFDLSDPA